MHLILQKEYSHLFELNIVNVREALQLISQLQRASSLPPNDHNFMVRNNFLLHFCVQHYYLFLCIYSYIQSK